MKQKPTASTNPQPAGKSGGPSWIIVAGVVAAIAIGAGLMYSSTSSVEQPATAATAASAPVASPATPASVETPAGTASAVPAAAPAASQTASALQPNLNTPLPPLPFSPQMARPAEVVKVAYEFVGRHPEVANFVPCFCGCEHSGHVSNEHCFVTERGADGSVAAWEPHGLHCAVCIDVARDSAQLHASGASVKDIRRAIEGKYESRFPSKTPTPLPQ